MSKRDRERKRERVASAQDRAEQAPGGFERTATKLPDGCDKQWMKVPTVEKVFTWSVVPFKATKSHPQVLAGKIKKGDLVHERTYFLHQNIGPSGKGAYVCLQKTFGKPCPICEWANAEQSKPNHDKETVKKLWPKERQLFNIFDHDEPAKGAQPWEVSYHLFGKQLYEMVKNGTKRGKKWQYFANTDGSGYKIITTGKPTSNPGIPKPFMSFGSISFEQRKEEIPDEVLESAVCLDKCIIETPYDQLKEIFMGRAKDKKTATLEKGDEVEFKKGKKTISGEIVKINEEDEEYTIKDEEGKKHVVDFADTSKTEADEDEDEDEDEDSDIDEKPAKKGKTKDKKPAKKGKKSKDDEDEDEDEDSDIDDEDEDEDEDSDIDDEDEDEDSDVDEKPAKKKGKK